MTTTVATKPSEKQLTDSIMDYARKIWLAGLGAFSNAEKEGGKLFETLVQRGEKFEAQSRKKAEGKIKDVKGEVKGKVEEIKDTASDTWNKLEKVFQKRVARALHRLGVPNRNDVKDLSKQLDSVQQAIQELTEAEKSAITRKRAKVSDIVSAA